MRPSIESARTASPAYSITWPVAPSVPILANNAQCQIFCRYALGQIAAHLDQHRFRFLLRQTLRGQNVFDFTRANAKSNVPKAP